MKYVFIVNPISGGISIDKKIKIIEEVCKERHLDYEIVVTEGKGDATKIAITYKNKPDHIIFSVGGDGTMNEVLNGLVGTNNMFGIIPLGSGNDFNKTLATIPEKEVMSDVGVINNRYFLNVLCIGIDSFVGYNAEKLKKTIIPPSQIYNASVLYSLFKYRPEEMEFTFNEVNYRDRYMILTICNGKYYGNGYMISPEAQINSGSFDVFYVRAINKIMLSILIPQLKKGTHVNNKKHVHQEVSKALHIKANHDLICNIDGEILIDKEFDIQILEKAIKIFNDREFINDFLVKKR